MRKETVKRGGKTFDRVSKVKASQAFTEGKCIYAVPEKIRFDNSWQSPIRMKMENSDDTFEKWLNEMLFYLPIEEGRYFRFFLESAET